MFSNPISNKGTAPNSHHRTCHNRNMPAENRMTTSTGARALGFGTPSTAAARQTYENLYKSHWNFHIKTVQLNHQIPHARSTRTSKM